MLGSDYYLANYTAGVRRIDLTDIAGGNLVETGYFDTYPNNDLVDFRGVWSVYPYLPSGNVLVNDIDSGFFLIAPSD